MNERNLSARLLADLGQFQLAEVYADAAYTDDDDDERFASYGRLVEIDIEDLYQSIEREEGPDGERLRSCLARAIASANPVVASFKYLGCKVRIVKAVRHG